MTRPWLSVSLGPRFVKVGPGKGATAIDTYKAIPFLALVTIDEVRKPLVLQITVRSEAANGLKAEPLPVVESPLPASRCAAFHGVAQGR